MLDQKMIFSDAQAITGDVASTNSIKNPASTHQIDQAVKKFLFKASVGTLFAGGTSLITSLQDSADGITYANTLIVSADIAQATLVAGYIIIEAYLEVGLLQWLQAYYDDTGAFTGGTVNARLIVD